MRSISPRAATGTVAAVALCVLPFGAACSTRSAVPTPSTTVSTSSPSSSSPASPATPVPVETAPPGDIPDNLAFVRYANTAGGYAFTHPEGWAQAEAGTRVQFTDKLNGVTVDSATATTAPTVSTARTAEVARLQGAVPAFELRDVSSATVPAGSAVRIVYRRNSDPDLVTGKVYRDEVEEYLVYASGRLVRMTLFGPVGADNVDAYKTMAQSLVLR